MIGSLPLVCLFIIYLEPLAIMSPLPEVLFNVARNPIFAGESARVE